MIKVIQWNCRGLGQRAAELRTRLLDRPDECPYVLLLEEANTTLISIRGFTGYAFPSIPYVSGVKHSSPPPRPGCALVYVCSDWPQHQIDLEHFCTEYQEIIAVRVTALKQHTIVFASGDIRPRAERNIYHGWISHLAHQTCPQDQKLYGGDFNLHHAAWGYSQQTKEAEKLLDEMGTYRMHLMNKHGSKTRMAAAIGQKDTSPYFTWTLNIFYNHLKLRYLPYTGRSDHFPIAIEFSTTRKPKKGPTRKRTA